MAQTPAQRRANQKFAKDNEARMGKSKEDIKARTKEQLKSPISPMWIGIFGFIVFGGLLFELVSRFVW